MHAWASRAHLYLGVSRACTGRAGSDVRCHAGKTSLLSRLVHDSFDEGCARPPPLGLWRCTPRAASESMALTAADGDLLADTHPRWASANPPHTGEWHGPVSPLQAGSHKGGGRSVTAHGCNVKLQVWDRSGEHDTYGAILSAFYKRVVGGLICYDASSVESFQSVEHWVKVRDIIL